MVLIAHLDSPFFPLLIHLFYVSAHICTFTRSNPISGKLLNRNITWRLSCHADVIDSHSACICSLGHVALIWISPSAKQSLKVRQKLGSSFVSTAHPLSCIRNCAVFISKHQRKVFNIYQCLMRANCMCSTQSGRGREEVQKNSLIFSKKKMLNLIQLAEGVGFYFFIWISVRLTCTAVFMHFDSKTWAEVLYQMKHLNVLST